MNQENYLYFANAGNNDADKDAVMYPASAFRGAVTLLSNKTEFFFAPRDGTGTVPDGVDVTHSNITANTSNTTLSYFGSEEHFKVMEEFCQLASRNRMNNNNFTVIRDLNANLPANEGAISAAGISDISAMTITTH